MILRDIFEDVSVRGDFKIMRLGDEILTASVLLQRAARMAGHLHRQCPKEGIIAVISPSPWDAAVGLLAGLLAHRTVSLINPFLDEATQAQQLSLLGSPIIIDAKRASGWVQYGEPFDQCSESLSTDRAAVVVFTSGSSGQPKAILHSETSLAAIVERSFHLYPQGVDLISMPMHSLGGIQCLLVNLALRRCLGLARTPEREEFCRAALQYLPETILCFPSYAAALLDFNDTADLCSAIEVIHTGGEKLTFNLRCRLEKGLSCHVYPAYGMAEFGPIAVNRSTDSKSVEALGEVLPEMEIRLSPVLDESENGQIGELLVAGPSTMLGYRHADGRYEVSGYWLNTGDILQRDADGNLWHMGRKSDFMTFGGALISLSEIECLLAGDPIVKAVAAVKARQESVTLFVVLERGVEKLVAKEKIRALLDASWRGIVSFDDIQLLNALPLNAAGKVDRLLLSGRVKDERLPL